MKKKLKSFKEHFYKNQTCYCLVIFVLFLIMLLMSYENSYKNYKYIIEDINRHEYFVNEYKISPNGSIEFKHDKHGTVILYGYVIKDNYLNKK